MPDPQFLSDDHRQDDSKLSSDRPRHRFCLAQRGRERRPLRQL